MSLGYGQGTNAFGAIQTYEDYVGEATPSIITMDVTLNHSLIQRYGLGMRSRFYGQWSKVNLLPEDELFLGSRYKTLIWVNR